MDKFHFQQIQNAANKVRKAVINKWKHEVAFGKIGEAEQVRIIKMLAEQGVRA